MTGGVPSRCTPRSRGAGLSELCKTSGVHLTHHGKAQIEMLLVFHYS
jgi:hypothetical protein